MIYILFTAPSEAIVQLAIEHIYPLVLPFKLTNIFNDKCLVRVIGGTESQEQNSGILESTDNFSIHRPVGELVIKRWQLNTLAPIIDKKIL